MKNESIVRRIGVGVVTGVTVLVLAPAVIALMGSFANGGVVSLLGGATKAELMALRDERPLMVDHSEQPLVVVDGDLPDQCHRVEEPLSRGCPGEPGCDGRAIRCTVTFDQTFAWPPRVTLALAGFEGTGRVQLWLDGVETDRFNFQAHTWDDNTPWGAWVNWTAIGPASPLR